MLALIYDQYPPLQPIGGRVLVSTDAATSQGVWRLRLTDSE
jgi:hypothetical protein